MQILFQLDKKFDRSQRDATPAAWPHFFKAAAAALANEPDTVRHT
jgi:hypothetical protein